MRLHGAIVLLAALLALVTAQQRKWGCGGVFRHPGCAGGGPGCELPVGSVGQPWVPRGTPYGDGLGGSWHWASRSRIGPRVGCGVGVGPPSTGLSPSLGMGRPQYKEGSASPLLCAHGDPTGTPSLCAQAMPRGPRGDRVPQPVGQRRDAGGALTPSSPALQLS